MANLWKPGPQPENAGITPGYSLPGVITAAHIETLEDRIVELEEWVAASQDALNRQHEATIDRLHQFIFALAERCAGQSDLLSKRAEK